MAVGDSRNGDLGSLRLVVINYITSANCANFKYRLQTVAALADIFEDELPKSANLLRSIRQYYAQFTSFTEKQIMSVKSAIEKELTEFVAIQRWKDINFYARKEATTKIRRQLFKFVKKLREKLVDKGVEELFKIPMEKLEMKYTPKKTEIIPLEGLTKFENLSLSNEDKLMQVEKVWF